MKIITDRGGRSEEGKRKTQERKQMKTELMKMREKINIQFYEK